MIENVIECHCERAVIVGVVSQLLFQPTILALAKVGSIISSAMLISNPSVCIRINDSKTNERLKRSNGFFCSSSA